MQGSEGAAVSELVNGPWKIQGAGNLNEKSKYENNCGYYNSCKVNRHAKVAPEPKKLRLVVIK